MYRRGALIRPERDRGSEAYVVNSGWLFSFILLGDGSRQILRLHLPGDMVGLSCSAFSDAAETLMAVTDVRVIPIDRNALIEMFMEYPRLGAALFLLTQAEQVSLGDRLASIGRTTAKSRVAALLIDTVVRLRQTNSEIGSSFVFPLTQEEIGDATGLTAVHVNRMFRVLVREGLIARNSNQLSILDEPRLTAVASYVNRYVEFDGSILPPSSRG